MSGEKDDERTVFQPPSGDGGGAGNFAPLGDGLAPPSRSPPPPPPYSPVSPAPARTGQIAVGDVLNGIYRITRFIARGGMGEVYEAVNIHPPGERVAVKVMLASLASDELVMAMFAKEAATLTRLHHEAIVPYRLAARDLEGRPFIVTEFVDGPSLEERLGAVRLTDAQFGDLARRLARGLGAAHELGAIHRDIAPDNILLVDGNPERPKIIDFGIARDAREQQQGTIVGDGFAGKLRYVAPEQLGEYARNIGPWTDLYSLALTLLAVASGRHADMGGSIADAVRKRMAVPDLSAIPARYRASFEQALQPDPTRRPQSMADFTALLYHAEGQGTGGFAPLEDRPSSPPRSQVQPKRPAGGGSLAALPAKLAARLPRNLPGGKWTARGALAAVVLVLGIVGIVLVTSSDEEAGEPRVAEVDKSPNAGPAAIAPGSPQFASLAGSLAAAPACSWLTFDGADRDIARFVGGAGNPAAAQSAIADGLTAKAAGSVSLDMGEVVTFDESMCGAVDALREFRAPDDLVTSPQRTYEAEQQVISLADGRKYGEGKFAKPLFRIGGLRPDDDMIFIVIEANKNMQPLFNGRDNGNMLVSALSGTTNSDGYDVPYPAELAHPPKESYGIAVVAGKGPFPIDLFGDPSKSEPAVPLDSRWPDRFRAEARAKGWRTDIFWFSVADDVPG